MKIVFRADSSTNIGSGHIMRCLTLASCLVEKGHECCFVCRILSGNIIDLIIEKGFSVYGLPTVEELFIDGQKLFHSHWLGVSQQTDAKDTISILDYQNIRPDWLIVDHYAIDEEWETIFSQKYPMTKILVIDDLADRNHKCDLLLDQNLDATKQKYQSRVMETKTKILAGVEYALLRPEFASLRKKSLARRIKPQLKKILLNLGGVDKNNITGKILLELEKADLPSDLRITVVMGKTAPYISQVQQLAQKSLLNIDVKVNVSNMAELMANSDLAIGAAGSASWERCCLGLPTLLLILAKNQKNVAEILDHRNIAKIVDVANIAEVLEKITPHNLKEMSNKAISLIDGKGVIRLVEYMQNKIR